MKKIVIAIVSVLFLIVVFSFTRHASLHDPLPAPEDMVLVTGNENFRSFYLSVSEEPNINWMLYRSWQKRVFIDYPMVYEQSKPNATGYSRLFKYNDPGVEDCSSHPAFAYYPVTGVSWIQIQNYLMWKTDRLNETNLINLGILMHDLNQAGAENFNTEAYLAGQYEGLVRKYIEADDDKSDPRRPVWSDQLFMPGYRLPTEAEWDYAASTIPDMEFVGCDKSKQKAHPFKLYFVLKEEIKYSDINFYNYYNLIEKSEIKFKKNSDNPEQLTSIKEFKKTENALANMAGNVREWCFDLYKEEKSKLTDWVEIYKANGFTENCILKSYDGYPTEKDSIGRMQRYRVLGGKSFEEPLYLGYDLDSGIITGNRVVKGGTFKNPDKKLRTGMDENSSSADIGFRCAMTYVRRY